MLSSENKDYINAYMLNNEKSPVFQIWICIEILLSTIKLK